ncbi:hypothetical protein SAMN04488109_1810 [Chryseolinea serpens]|uniref:Protein argonaute n=1 Tax=Chryseolinea serpens TaxID=947013 RepID=A0A1M5MLN6_9BACT|nr:SIR2 family protein [Chryseolinea serpens]SHG78228.1 hypothetical protein SAMN04488109_1810 [Chryseolinea serpens]
MSKTLALDYDAFIRSVKRNTDISHSMLLGAGASISSGIQSAGDCIWEWKKDIYLSRNHKVSDFYKNIKSDAVRQSIQKWLDAESGYPANNSSEEYSFYAEKAYPISDDRRKYFQSLVQGKEPYVGYKLLCLLNEYEIVKAVWTLNFDGLCVKAAHQANLTPIEITLDSVERIFRSQSRKELLSIALHGDFKYGALKNTSDELDNQNAVFVETFRRYHMDKNLIVLGYSGRDKSTMQTLKDTFSVKGSGRLYWCGYGHDIPESVEELLELARGAGREAYFIPTDGFDRTLIHLSKACFEDDKTINQKIDGILSSYATESYEMPDFSQDVSRTDKYLKSNLHPIRFPKEVFQFEIVYKHGEKPWSLLNELSKNDDMVAVPFKRKVFAIATLSTIHKVFKGRLKGEILRVPISKQDVGKVTAFSALMLKAILRGLTSNKDLAHNSKDKLWLKREERITAVSNTKIGIHKAIHVSLFFDLHATYAFLSFKPTVELSSAEEISREVRQSLSKGYLEKLRNKQYEEFLEEWKIVLFDGENLKFQYPNNSGTGFEFSISNNTSFAEVLVADPNFRAFHPKVYDKRRTQHKGIQLLEPQLVFSNSQAAPSRDFHPMRALINHRPYDYPLNGQVYSSEINVGVICGQKYADKFYKFLNELHQKHRAEVNPDYLLDYPGFSSAFKIPINVPYFRDDDKWVDVQIDHEPDIKSTAIKLARLITAKIDQLVSSHSQLVVTIFIPSEWQQYREFEDSMETFNLHDYIKAFSASKGISTQLIEEDTLSDALKCQIFWWLSLSFYVKSLRTPWILNTTDSTTAFAGIGYSIKRVGDSSEIVLGCSHIYNSQGQGLKYKLSKIDDFFLDRQSNPFLSYNDAFQFGVSIRELFYSSMDSLPERVVVHKRTRFTVEEVKGITESLNMAGVKNIDLIEINYEPDARFFATSIFSGEMGIDGFPVSRGTCIVTDRKVALLWTHGIVPSIKSVNYKYYLGGRSIPAPLKITRHFGDTNINTIASEILGLTKMNWNSFDLYTKLPATINSSNQIARIGKLLARFEGKTYDYRLFI